MKKLLIGLFALLLSANCMAQFNTATFDGSTSYVELYNPLPLYNNSVRKVTAEIWAKSIATTDTQTIISVGGDNGGGGLYAGKFIMRMYIHAGTLYATYGDTCVTAIYPADTMWHYLKFVCDTSRGKDSLSLYVDNSVTHLNTTHKLVNQSFFGNFFLGCDFKIDSSINYNFFKGQLTRLVITDTTLYSNTTPDCVYDTLGFSVNLDTLTGNTLVVAQLNDIQTDSIYEQPFLDNYVGNIYPFNPLTNITYTSGSPCAPIDTIYTIAGIGTYDTLVAHNSNASYMKGANIGTHYNGWDTSLHTLYVDCPNITYGTYTDKLGIDTLIDSTYIYHSAYRSMSGDTTGDTTITITHTSLHTINIEKEHITLFPNPSTGTIYISQYAKLSVYDMSGKCILNTYDNSFTIHTTGTYMVLINNKTYKICIE